jgi:hypothetical protein
MTDEIQPEHDRRYPPAESQWHLDKKVPLSLIFALVVQTVIVVIAFQDVKRDVELLKAAQVVLHERNAQQSNDMRESMAQVRDQFKTLNEKMDRIIERGINK